MGSVMYYNFSDAFSIFTKKIEQLGFFFFDER